MLTKDENIRRAFVTVFLPWNRFAQLLHFTSSDDKESRFQRKQNYKLAALREVWDSFVENSKKLFELKCNF